MSHLIAKAEGMGVIRVEKYRGTGELISLKQPQTEPPKETPATVQTSPAEKLHIDRPQEYFDTLSKNDFGPYTAIRAKLYDLIAEFAKERSFAPSVILRKAVYSLRDKEKLKGIYLENVSLFLHKLFARRAVLIGENENLVSPGALSDIDAKVCGFNSEEWRDELDAAILELLIEKDGKVRNSEFSELAVALLNERGENGQARIAKLLGRLYRAKRLRMDANGYLHVVAQQ